MGPAIIVCGISSAFGFLGFLLAGWPGALVAYGVSGTAMLYGLSLVVEEDRYDD